MVCYRCGASLLVSCWFTSLPQESSPNTSPFSVSIVTPGEARAQGSRLGGFGQ